MDIEKILIYVVLGLIYYGFKFLKKKGETQSEIKPKPSQGPFFEKFKPDPNLPQPYVKPGSMMELLEEVRNQEKQQKYRQPASLENSSLEGKGYEEAEPERLEVENINPYTAFRAISAEGQNTSKFSEFEPVVRKPHPIRKIFNEKQKLREAFIVSEILKRKEL